jgi:hypothetical protein
MARAHTAIKVEGGLLPGDFLRKLAQGDSSVPGLDAASYHLEGARLHDAIAASWNSMRSRWANLRTALEGLPDSDTATSLTRERFLLPLFAELQYGRLVPEKAREIDGSEYPISHYWRNSPIHLLGYRVPLDRRSPGVQGAARTSPHSLIQDYLNRTEAALWGFLSNGQVLRILHDNKTMARPSFIEFDLVTMFETEVYSDFVILWLLCHQSRVESEDPYQCRLEQWVTVAQEQGTRALDKLRHGVATALNELGQGFLEEISNAELRRALKEGTVSNLEYYRQLIRVVYRLMFLLAGEDRDLLFARDCNPAAKSNYLRFYSASRLREMAAKVYGTRHGDLWEGLKTIFGKLSDDGCADLALPALNSFLWDPKATSALNSATLSNSSLLNAVRNLTYITAGSSRQRIDYKNIGAEEIGGIYENIIAFSPLLDVESFTFSLGEGAFSERDETASHYTPTSLVDELLNSALDPVLDRAEKQKDAAAAILALKVCDRACGSGHFLVAAAKRMAKRLATIRSGEVEPSPAEVQRALRDVIAHCIYGVDLNPTAVELCKFSLWLESMDCGRPLSFLENRIKTGNALLGATPAAISAGIPDDAFTALSADDKAVVAALKKQNKQERADIEQGQEQLFSQAEVLWTAWVQVRNGAERIIALDDDAIENIHQKQAEYDNLLVSDSYLHQKLIADAWCAAFMLPRTKGGLAITAANFAEIRNDPSACPVEIRSQVTRIATEHSYFHWHIEYPEVFSLPKNGVPENTHHGWTGGFDVNLGNPPWDRVNFEAKKFFAGVRPDIAVAKTTTRRRLLAALEQEDAQLWSRYQDAQRQAAAVINFFQNSGIYSYLYQARLNTYSLFTELNATTCTPEGRCGIIVPSGVATDDSSVHLFNWLVLEGRIVSLLDFENKGIFPAVHDSYKFCLLTLTGNRQPNPAEFAFFLRNPSDAKDSNSRFQLSSDELRLISPITGLCPTFRSRSDRDLAVHVYRKILPLIKQQESGSDWSTSDFLIMFRSDDSSHLYKTVGDLGVPDIASNTMPEIRVQDTRFVPVWESKLLHQFDHRYATFEGVSPERRVEGDCREVAGCEKDQTWIAVPRSWVPVTNVEEILASRRWARGWMAGYRDITNATNERTSIASILPKGGAAQPLNLFLPQSADHAVLWVSAMNSFALDYFARQRIGGVHLNITTCRQLPVVGPSALDTTWLEFIRPRVLELVYSSPALASFAADAGCHGAYFRWNEERRFLLRCELDAAFFHIYLGSPEEWANGQDSLLKVFPTSRSVVDFVMESFPIVKRKDCKSFGIYRTKDTILEIYDEITNAQRAGQAYQTRLSPPPADPSIAHAPPVEPLVLPTAKRSALADADYMLLVALTALEVSGGEISTKRLMNACKLLALPDQLAKFGADSHGKVAQQWRRRFTDTLDPKLFLPTIRDLVARGAVKLVPQGEGSRTVWVDRAGFKLDIEIEFDVRFALEVGDAIAAEQLSAIPEIATVEQLRPLYSAA